MAEFLQFHGFAHFPASIPNRGRDGEPKDIVIGNVPRMRISSQCLKRTWRVSDLFREAFGEPGEKNLAQRTKETGSVICRKLLDGGFTAPHAEQWTLVLASVFGATKPEKKGTMDHLRNETLFLLLPEERIALFAYIDKIIREKTPPPNVKGKEELAKEAAKIRPQIMKKESSAVDAALFGRMFADDKDYSIDACCQVAHAFSVTPFDVVDDCWTAVDDLKEAGEAEENRGGGHISSQPLGAGVFYYHITINVTGLRERLKDPALVSKACRLLVEAVCTVFPGAKGNSCAQASVVFFGRLEKGDKAPRNLSIAFLDAVDRKGDVGNTAVRRLLDMVASIDKVYGQRYTKCAQFNALTGEGTLKDLLDLAGEAA